MKHLFSLLLCVSFGLTTTAKPTVHLAKTNTALITADDTAEGIQFFEGDWQAALEKAKKEKKLIFMDAYASWCGPCKMMARGTFTKKDVGEFFNANFINVKMDMEKHAEGRRLSNKYQLQAYPTLYFINGDEELVLQEIGYQKPGQLLAIGKKVVNMGTTPESGGKRKKSK